MHNSWQTIVQSFGRVIPITLFLLCGVNPPTRAQQVSGVQTLVSKQYIAGYLALQFDIYNNGTKTDTDVGYGHRVTYTSQAPGRTMYDIATAMHSVWYFAPLRKGGQMFGNWIIAEGPTDQTSYYGIVGAEINFVNRGDDTGWSSRRSSLPRFSSGLQVVPESNTFTHGGTPNNVSASIVLGPSPSPRSDGKLIQSYNGILIEDNTIAPGGRAITITGDTINTSQSAATTPYGITTVLGSFNHGTDTTLTRIFDDTAYRMLSTQKVAWTSADSSRTVTIGSDEVGNVTLQPAASGTIVVVLGGIPHALSIGAPDSGGPGKRALTLSN